MWVFWKYDLFPFCLGAEVEGEIHEDGKASPKGYPGMSVKPLIFLGDEEGKRVSCKLQALKKRYAEEKAVLSARFFEKAREIADFIPKG